VQYDITNQVEMNNEIKELNFLLSTKS